MNVLMTSKWNNNALLGKINYVLQQFTITTFRGIIIALGCLHNFLIIVKNQRYCYRKVIRGDIAIKVKNSLSVYKFIHSNVAWKKYIDYIKG